MSTHVLQQNTKLIERFVKIKENGKSFDAKISRQQTGQSLIIGALKSRLEGAPKVVSRLSDKAVQRS